MTFDTLESFDPLPPPTARYDQHILTMASPKESVVYELLGAPNLLYRHDYSLNNMNLAHPWGMDAREAKYLHRSQQQVARVRARWHHAVDHAFRINYQPKPRKKKRTKRKRFNDKNTDAQEKDSDEALGETEGARRRVDEHNQESADENMQQDNEETETDSSDDVFYKRRKERRFASSVDSEIESDDETRDAALLLLSWKAQANDESDKVEPAPAAPGEEDESSSDTCIQEVAKPCSKGPHEKKRKERPPLLDPEFLKRRTDPTVLAARQHVLLGEEAKVLIRSYQQYGHSYLPSSDRKRKGNTTKLSKDARRKSREMHVDRLNADPAYLAPVDFQSLHYCLDDEKSTTAEEKKLITTKRRRKTYPVQPTYPESPLLYGNCLVCASCPCNACDENDNEEFRRKRSWFLIHPTGELLSSVCVSSLLLPFDDAGSPLTISREKKCKEKYRQELDVGETILQIIPCGDGNFARKSSHENQGIFVVRSTSYCTVIRVETYRRKNEVPTSCPGKFNIEELTRIDLRSLSRSFPSFKPMDIATHPRYGNKLSNPKFAILTGSRNDRCNTIHHVSIRGTPLIEEYNIPSLKSISCIDFASTHPMTLWAAAESYVRPKLVTEIYSKKPLLGHGHSLYTIDLRVNKATFQWSPSAEEMVVEGVHSISAIMTDWNQERTVWVSSSSAGKTWEIDGRMPCRAVNTFSLASVSDEGKTILPAMGLLGGGSILTLPVGLSSPILSVDKTPGSAALRVLQRPEFRPRFQTNSLECVACPGLSSRVSKSESSIARTSLFPLPDVSGRIFTCGLTSFRTSASHLMSTGALELLGYANPPENALCTLTMTNKGDLYSHFLLECHNGEESRAKAVPGLPLGCSAIAVSAANNPPNQAKEKQHDLPIPKTKGGWVLPLSLTNEFPLSTAELSPMSVKSKKECRPFSTVRLEHLPTYHVKPRTPVPTREEEESDEDKVAPEKHEASLLSEYSNAAHREVARLKDCFSLDRKSVVEIRSAREEPFRSDMTSETFKTALDLWDEEEDIKNHTAVNSTKENHNESNQYSANI